MNRNDFMQSVHNYVGQIQADVVVKVIVGLAVAATISLVKSVREWFVNIARVVSQKIREKWNHGELWTDPGIDDLKKTSKILVIDDEDLPHYNQLTLRGFAVERWQTVDAKKSPTIDSTYDLLILDVRGIKDHFGATDGIDALPMIRRDNPWIPIIIFTAHMDAQKEKIEKAEKFSQGTEGKNLPFTDFEERVTYWLQQTRSRDYALATLKRLGVANAMELCDQIGRTPVKEIKYFLADHKTDSTREYQVQSVINTLSTIATGKRWSTKQSNE